MSQRKTPYQCANPLCVRPFPPDEQHSIEVVQMQPDGSRWRWHLCDGWPRQYLTLCAAKERAQAADPERSGVEP